MHDFTNDLAQSVAEELCFKLENGKKHKLSKRTRHLSYVGNWYDGMKKFEAFDQVNALRTFLPLRLPETLLLRECKQLEKLPSEIGNLMELHCLDIRGSNSIKGMPSGVDDFCLSQLENVKVQDAWEAMLNEKHGIDNLKLQWSADFGSDKMSKEHEEQVLDILRPHKRLGQLTIENCGGAKFSAWITDFSFKNLLSLKLRDFKNCKSLPSTGKLPLLKDLSISGFNEVNEVGAESFGENQFATFVSLETLYFEDMLNWTEWDPCDDDK
ncbi:hypothetical protein DITRI_Ditri13aG0021700 [Diplodiscus trichospermus]